MKIECSRQTCAGRTDRQTDRHCDSLGSLSEPKKKKRNISSSMVKNGNGCAAMTYNGENTTKWIMTCPEDLYSISFLFGQPDIMFVSNGLSSYLERFP